MSIAYEGSRFMVLPHLRFAVSACLPLAEPLTFVHTS